jgi:Ig domain of plant-specific actin-binding protein
VTKSIRFHRTRWRHRFGLASTLALAALAAVLGPAGGSSAATAVAQAAPGNTARPTIVGDVQQGSGVAASTGAWSNSPTSFSYQWSRCDSSCSTIDGATSETYVVTSSDAGHDLKVTVTAMNGSGSTPADSTTSTVATLPSGAPADEASPTISGTAKQGQTLTASSGSWSGGTLSYRWRRCDTTGAGCSSISGATGSTYTAASEDVGSTLRVEVTAANGSAKSTAQSAKTGIVVAGSAPANTSKPTISGNVVQGETLTADRGNWSGDSPITYGYQWLRCNSSGSSCSHVGSNNTTYGLGSGDVNHTIEVTVTGTNSVGVAAATSDHTAVVVAPTKPANHSQPSISGNLTQSSTLTVNPGNWSGTEPLTFSYQWQRCDSNGHHCGNVRNATGNTYELTSGDVGHRLRTYVTAKNTVGSTTAVSKTTGVVGAGAPVNTSPPVISGSARQGSTVKASTGSWSSALPVAVYHFQWFRCDTKGANCTGIVGASKSDYVVVSADVGHTLLVQVRAQTTQDSAIANSKPSSVVAAAPPANAISVGGLALPDRLEVDKVQFSPRKITSRKQPLVARIHVREIQNGRSVSGALVKAIAIPYSRLSKVGETATDGNGWATMTFTVRNTFPLRKGYLITVFVRARKPGESVLAGISTRRLVALRVG